MNSEESIRQGEAYFYSIVKSYPLTIRERITAVRLHEEFGYHNDTCLFLDVIGESGKYMWQYPNKMPIDYPLEKMQPLGEYLSHLFSCPLEIKLIGY